VQGILYSLPDQVAANEGIFEDNGLDVEFSEAPAGPVTVQLVVGGEADAGSAPPDLILKAWNAGQRLPIVSSALNAMTWFIVASPDFECDTDAYPELIECLRGKKLGVAARGASTELLFTALLREGGLEPTDVTFVPTGLLQTAIPAIQQGTVDVNLAFDPTFRRVEESGGRVWLSLGDVPAFDPWSHALYYMNDDFSAANPKAAEAFHRAIGEAIEWMNDPANFEALVDHASDLLGGTLDRDFVAELVTEQLPTYGNCLPQETFDHMAETLEENGLIEETVAYSDIVAPSLASESESC
jgi:NitT/TauT family transport system substrate-binding protein